MKWTEPTEGEARVITRFLLFPKKLGRTTRWLEVAKIHQIYGRLYSTRRNKHLRPRWMSQAWAIDACLDNLEGKPLK